MISQGGSLWLFNVISYMYTSTPLGFLHKLTCTFSKKRDCEYSDKGPVPVVYQSHNSHADSKIIIIIIIIILADFPRILYNIIIVSLHYGS